MAADIHLGAVYEDPASGTKAIPNTFTISWSGGTPGTELKQLVGKMLSPQDFAVRQSPRMPL